MTYTSSRRVIRTLPDGIGPSSWVIAKTRDAGLNLARASVFIANAPARKAALISTFQVAESMGFKGEFRQWEELLRVGGLALGSSTPTRKSFLEDGIA